MSVGIVEEGSLDLGWSESPGGFRQWDSMLRDVAEGGPDLRWGVRHHVAIRVRDGHVGDEFHLR